jgi:hypothetical protein
MKKLISLALAGLLGLLVAASALGDNPFPGTHITGKVFVSAQTLNPNLAVTNYFAPQSAVVFRVLAMNTKTHKYLTTKQVKHAYIRIPNQPNVRLKYQPKVRAATGKYTWIRRWTVPAAYPLGTVNFTVVFVTKTNQRGTFKQLPVAASQLTVSSSPPPDFGAGPTMPPPPPVGAGAVPLYVDTVNGSRPKDAPPRTIGCTQTNVFKQGEQIVVRAFGYDMSDGSVLTPANVTDAHFSVPGQPNVILAWGGHGPDPKVWYWTMFWNIPKDYPLGDIPIKVSFTTVGGKTGVVYYVVSIIPQ